MMLPKIEIGLMKIVCSCNSIYIWWLPYAKDFACTSAGAQTSLRPNVPARKRSAPELETCAALIGRKFCLIVVLYKFIGR